VIYFSGKPAVLTTVEFGMDEPPGSVEVELIESAPPAPAEPPPAPEPPQPDPVPETPKPEPVPEPVPEPPTPKEETIPLPPEPKPQPKPVEQKPKTPPRPATAPRTTAAPASAKPAQAQSVGGAGGGAATGARGGATSGPGHLYNPKPAYPSESRAAKEHGTVLLSVGVDVSGRPTSVSVSKSCGFPRLDRAAQEAVRRWRFKPAMRNGVPYASSVVVPIRFALAN
jgi:protein TonB